MMYLGIALYIILIVGIFEQIILAFNRPELMMRVFLIRMLVYMTLILVFVPTSIFGYPMLEMKAAGAALAFLCSWLVYALIIFMTSHRISGLLPYKKLWLHIIAGAFTVTVLYLISLFIVMEGLLMFFALALLAEILFFGFLIVCKEFQKNDLDLIISMINPSAMLQYIREEVSKK